VKSYKKLVGLVFGLLLAMNTANAGLLIEPHLGYNIHGSGDNGGYDYSYTGAQYGLRLGYQNLGLMVGMDYTGSSGSVDAEKGSTTLNQNYTSNDIGVFAGYNFPILVRAWAAYYFSNTMKYKSDDTKASGDTKELGVGFTGLPFLSINVIYRMVNHDEFTAASGAKSAIDYSFNEIVLGVSLPLTL
jgi:hypothetical protein